MDKKDFNVISNMFDDSIAQNDFINRVRAKYNIHHENLRIIYKLFVNDKIDEVKKMLNVTD